jgi:hypothetical protein
VGDRDDGFGSGAGLTGLTAGGGDTGAGTGLTGGATTGDSPTTGAGSTTDDSAGDSGDGSSSGGIKFDTLSGDAGNAGDGGATMGCQKVDFLFVIDNSGSMSDEQQNLVSSFPGFIGAIQDTLMAQNFHIMVIDTDAGTGGSSVISCQPDCCATACKENPGAICNGKPCTPMEPCDTTLGAGKTKSSEGDSCAIASGQRYMTDLQPNLGATFACVGKVGVNGDGNERPVEAMLEALSPGLNDPGQCNEAFLRKDAILVATLITDEEDEMKSPGDPAAWHDALVAVKGGNEDAVVMLGLVGDADLQNPVCDPYANGGAGAEAAPRLRALVESFPKGVWGSVCEPDYSPFFLDAVSVIDAACDDFTPEG